MTDNSTKMRSATINFLKDRIEKLAEEIKSCTDLGMKQLLKQTYLLNKRLLSELEGEEAKTILHAKN